MSESTGLEAVTPLILTYNERANIERTLAPLAWARRIVVVDSFSDDGTLEVLRAFPSVDVLQRPFDTFAEQCNFGLDNVATEWVLALDADYVCTKAFLDDAARRTTSSEASGFSARFIYYIHGKPLRGTLYPPRIVLFRRDRARFVQDGHTQRLLLHGSSEMLSGPILHDDRKPLGQWLKAQERYSREEAEKLAHATGRLRMRDEFRRRLPLLSVALMPAYCLIVKLLLLDGIAGLFYTAQRTYAELLLSLRLLELRLRNSSQDGQNCKSKRNCD
jgi:glycosyltransferase involved in cell wall biosynthesis